MSDLSNIAHDYELNAEFARKFNDAVLNLKRRYLLHRGDSQETRAATEASRHELLLMLNSLVLSLTDQGKSWTANQAQIPADVLDRLHKRLKGELPDTVNELTHAIDSLSTSAPLDESTFTSLDRVCEAADATASAAFRRLRRI